MGYGSFEDLDVWKKARELKMEILALVKTFPHEERYRLSDQLLRSSRGVGAQLAEGHGRKTWAEKLRFSVIARGSLSEILNHLIDALDEKLIDSAQLSYYKNKITDVEKLLNGYISFLERKSRERLSG
jgi:four helix bundle protein